MAQLPTNRTTANTAAEHVDDHNEVHRLHNSLDDASGSKGDILVHNGTGWVRLAQGTDDYVLTADDAQSTGLKWAAGGGGGGGGLSVFKKTSSWSVTEGGVYVVDTSGGNVTATLPLVSTTGTIGMRLVFKRLGANYLYVVCAGSDHFDLAGVTQKTLWNDDNALSIAAIPTVAATWMEFGYYGAVT